MKLMIQKLTLIYLEYNILKLFLIDNYIKEIFSVENGQNIFNLEVNYKIKFILLIEKMNKFIIYGNYYLHLFNAKGFKSEHKIKTNNNILSLNLMKDKETILLANEIKKIFIINNKLK